MNALRSTLRPIARAALPKAQKRQMGSGAAPQWTGIDKVIRDKFPEDYQGECETIIIKKIEQVPLRYVDTIASYLFV